MRPVKALLTAVRTFYASVTPGEGVFVSFLLILLMVFVGKVATDAYDSLLSERRAATERQKSEAEAREKRLDEAAQSSSYWSTTIRIDTDMDSSWLNNEERTCKTFPDAKGRVSIVSCNAFGNHRDHNIPVKFWGGVDRNTVSDWKCRREGEDFVCRAIN